MLTPSSTRTVGMALASIGPGEIGLDDVERLLAGRKLGGHAVSDVLVADLLAVLVLQQDRRAEGDPVTRGGRLDDLGPADLPLELGDAALDERLLLARGMIFRVLGEVA